MATPNRSERGGRGKTNLNNPKNGDTTIKEGHKFVFKNGKWVKASKQGNHVSRFAGARDKAHAEAKKITGESKPASKPPAPAQGNGGGQRQRPAGVQPSGGVISSPGGSRSAIHTYKEHGSDLHVGRHKTLAEHRAAVARAKGQSTADTLTSGVGPVADGDQFARDRGTPSSARRTRNDVPRQNPDVSESTHGSRRRTRRSFGNNPDLGGAGSHDQSRYDGNDEPGRRGQAEGGFAGRPKSSSQDKIAKAAEKRDNEKKRKSLAERLRERRSRGY